MTKEHLDSGSVSLMHVLNWSFSAAFIIGGIIPYIPQYLEIKKTKNAEGFSLYVCLTLIIANVLRILFWFGNRFELPLLVQSLIMNLAMLAMVRLCVQVKQNNMLIRGPERTFVDFDFRHFWKWTDFQSYVEFTLVFSLFAAVLTYVFLHKAMFVEILGFASVFTEALLAAPQFYDNFQAKSTYGMSRKMVCLWLVGDSWKTFYFVARGTPVQFWVCGALQISLDLAILSQIVWYGSSPGRRKKLDGLK